MSDKDRLRLPQNFNSELMGRASCASQFTVGSVDLADWVANTDFFDSFPLANKFTLLGFNYSVCWESSI